MLEAYLGLRRDLSSGAEPLAGSWSKLSMAMDTAVAGLVPRTAGLAVVALGSYGRCQLCIHSDIDLMLLIEGDETALPPLFRTLWDAGLAVGHSVRTPSQTKSAGADRLDTLCSLLDARLVSGDSELFHAMQRSVDQLAAAPGLSKALADEEHKRRRSEPHHLQALDLKKGRGGLRSLHGLRWSLGGSDAPEVASLRASEQSLLLARQAVHAVVGRAHDTIDFSLRSAAADRVEISTRDFLKGVYSSSREIDDAVTRHLNGAGRARASKPWRRRRGSSPSAPGPSATEGTNPWLIAKRAVERNQVEATLTPEERMSISSFDKNIWDAESRSAFIKVVSVGQGSRRIFEQFDELGFLASAMPEWSHVASQPQLDPFHIHPVDDHLWRTTALVAELAGSGPEEIWAAEVAADLESMDEVILGALFHDIGKGTGRDHSKAGAEVFEKFATRAGFDTVTIDVVSLLIREHLLLPQVATRRDLDDPDVIRNVAERIGNADVLRMLYLLTVADARATGPDVWTPWRSSLVRALFTRTIDAMTDGSVREAPLRTARVAEVAERWSGEIDPDRIEHHLNTMPDSYSLRTPAAEVRRHLVMLDPPPAFDDARLDVVDADGRSDLVVVVADRAGLLAMISGVLALSNISILEARLATRADGIAVDRLQVVDSLNNGPVDELRWPGVKRDLRAVLNDEISLVDRLDSKHLHYRSLVDMTVEPAVTIIGGADHGTHRIELHGADRVGLLHDVSTVLHELCVDVRFAKIDTQGGQVIDTFHVHLPDGLDHDNLTTRLTAAAGVPQPPNR